MPGALPALPGGIFGLGAFFAGRETADGVESVEAAAGAFAPGGLLLGPGGDGLPGGAAESMVGISSSESGISATSGAP